VVAASLALVVGRWQSDLDWRAVIAMALMLVLFASIPTVTESVATSMQYVILLAAVLLVGGAAAGLIAFAELAAWTPGRGWVKRIFNAGQFSLTASICGLVFGAFRGETMLARHQIWQLVALSLLMSIVYYLCNVTLVTEVIALAQRVPMARVWWGQMSWAAGSYLAYSLFALLLAVLWQISMLAGLLVLMPLLVARWTFAQYAAEQAAYDATVAAVVQAVETKDHYTRGHSERVSNGGVMIARQHGMREDRVALVRYAGLMHDVGKIGVPTRVLQKQGRLTPEEFEAITTHPLRGFEMLRDIGFLREAQSAIVHHHERIDGRGYPMGLKGDQIPDLARLISVADAFDSMTSTRSYRAARPVEAAIEELERCKGTQFDPVFVDDFVAALRRDGWVAQAEDFTGPDEGADAGHAGEGSDQVTISDPRDTNITLLRGPRFALDEAAS
jgi:HD-GYP domain-containing protein (c-di-GMP phosphodiesterase class II)